MGHLIRVLPSTYPERPSGLSRIAQRKESFFTFFPLAAAYKQQIVECVGNFPIPLGSGKPEFLRQALSIQKGGKVLNWRIINMGTGEVEVVDVLTDNQKLLSLRESWNDTLLIERICDNWLPKWNALARNPEAGFNFS